jgi:DNA-binding NtrC family response regulator
MSADLQVKLLRVLETGTINRIGGNEAIKVDVRVIAATNRVPQDAVNDGKLRQDMLYRLSVFPISLPPLRERREDIELLAEHFLAELNKQESSAKTFTPEALERMRGYDWPGNVRELRNAIHRAFILAEDEIEPELLPVGAPVVQSTEPSLEIKVGMTVADAERRLILATLHGCGGDKKKAADVLRISLKTLYNRIKEYKAGDVPVA